MATSKRNAYDGPGKRVVDLSLVRGFEFASTHRIEARIEAFNAFNWFRWGNPKDNAEQRHLRTHPDAGDPRDHAVRAEVLVLTLAGER